MAFCLLMEITKAKSKIKNINRIYAMCQRDSAGSLSMKKEKYCKAMDLWKISRMEVETQ